MSLGRLMDFKFRCNPRLAGETHALYMHRGRIFLDAAKYRLETLTIPVYYVDP